MTDKIKKNKNQHNDVIENEPKFDNTFSLSGSPKHYLSVLTISLIVVKKQRATMVYGLT